MRLISEIDRFLSCTDTWVRSISKLDWLLSETDFEAHQNFVMTWVGHFLAISPINWPKFWQQFSVIHCFTCWVRHFWVKYFSDGSLLVTLHILRKNSWRLLLAAGSLTACCLLLAACCKLLAAACFPVPWENLSGPYLPTTEPENAHRHSRLSAVLAELKPKQCKWAGFGN